MAFTTLDERDVAAAAEVLGSEDDGIYVLPEDEEARLGREQPPCACHTERAAFDRQMMIVLLKIAGLEERLRWLSGRIRHRSRSHKKLRRIV